MGLISRSVMQYSTPLVKTVTLDYNLRVMALLDAAIRSAETGLPVSLS